MAGPPVDPNMAAYARLMTEHQRETTRHWPIVIAAFAMAVAIGVASSGREPDPGPAAPAALSAR